ncbi:MAG TPA: ABC transporter permease [Tepidisphaeraceae bacterium]|jgi:ABC-type dipeptide/oligopeptide/nickel transport system permease subunit|nr:ABC transporter permease [Tepidisphaeraceae bacterium]
MSAILPAEEISLRGLPFAERPRRWKPLANGRIVIGGMILATVLLACIVSLFWTLNSHSSLYYENASLGPRLPPSFAAMNRWFGTDLQGRGLLARCLLGGAISLAIGLAAAAISVTLGVGVGLFAGYRGGWIDGLLMRSVDILYGLPYILMIILLKIALQRPLSNGLHLSGPAANLVVLFLAIGLVSWLTMARVVRGQVLTLRTQPFIEACRASGIGSGRIFFRHLLPNLVGPIVVYATLIVPQAILQESFLSFLGIGIAPPLPTWGSLASEGLLPALNPIHERWWLLVIPCVLLGITLLSLNFLGDGLRDLFDPRRAARKL